MLVKQDSWSPAKVIPFAEGITLSSGSYSDSSLSTYIVTVSLDARSGREWCQAPFSSIRAPPGDYRISSECARRGGFDGMARASRRGRYIWCRAPSRRSSNESFTSWPPRPPRKTPVLPPSARPRSLGRPWACRVASADGEPHVVTASCEPSTAALSTRHESTVRRARGEGAFCLLSGPLPPLA